MLFIRRSMHDTIVKAKEDEITELRSKVENRDILLAEMEKQAKVLYDENINLRCENAKLNDQITDYKRKEG